MKRILIPWIVIIALSGCGTYQTKGTASKGADEVAVLDVTMPFFNPWIFVHSIDGESRGFGDYSKYTLSPGKRVITILGNSQLGLSSKPTNIVFIAEAGKAYKLVYKEISNSSDWNMEIIDVSTKQRVDMEQYPANCSYSLVGGYDCSEI